MNSSSSYAPKNQSQQEHGPIAVRRAGLEGVYGPGYARTYLFWFVRRRKLVATSVSKMALQTCVSRPHNRSASRMVNRNPGTSRYSARMSGSQSVITSVPPVLSTESDFPAEVVLQDGNRGKAAAPFTPRGLNIVAAIRLLAMGSQTVPAGISPASYRRARQAVHRRRRAHSAPLVAARSRRDYSKLGFTFVYRSAP